MTTTAAPIPVRNDVEVIGLVGLAHGTSHFFHLMLPPLFPWLMKDFSLSYTEAGMLMTVFFVVSGVGQAVAGFVVDRIGARPVLFAGIGMLALSGIVLGVATTYPMLMLAAAVAGCGNSIFHPADFTLLNRRVAQPRLGHAFSVHGLSGNLGWAAAPVFMAGIAATAGWHAAGFAAAGVGAVVLAILWWRRDVLDDAAAEVVAPAHDASKPVPAHQLAFLASPAVWLCFAFFFLTTSAFGILQNYAPAILGNVYGVSLVLATAGLTAYLAGSAVGTIAGGFLATRSEHNERVIAMALGLAAVMALLLASGWVSSSLLLPMMAIMGFGVGTAGPEPRPAGAARGDEPVRQGVVRPRLRLRLLGAGHGPGAVAAALRPAARRRSVQCRPDGRGGPAGRVAAHGDARRRRGAREDRSPREASA